MPERKPTDRASAHGVRRKAGPPPQKPGRVGQPVATATLALPKVPRIPAGWRVIGAREFGEHLLSIRFLVLLVIMGIAGVLLVYTLSTTIRGVAGSLSDQLTTYTGEKFPLFLLLFSGSPNSGSTGLASFPSFASLVTLIIGPMIGIAFGFDAISNERSEGTLPRLVSQPIHRDDVINGKFAASLAVVALILGSVVAILAAVGLVRLGIIPSGDVAVRIVLWWVFLVLYVSFWLALATLFSVIFRRAATAVLAVLGIWLVVAFFGTAIASFVANVVAPVGANATTAEQIKNIDVQLALTRLLPSGQFDDITRVMLDPSKTFLNPTVTDPTNRQLATLLPVGQSLLLIWPQVVTLIGLTFGCFALAYVVFMRQEVRA